ncbi:substrate-binding periplasmic protein [Ancylobacter mangrovi]|uniref:substrate-binding periplasmic protein n=1 Tax=Ancylobacter mangrovi TaxID=2972472 RepID=UPI0021623B2C|nr:transporter substrate-binding domain-containing protein [Ancylobacter mangrovi]MCS0503364.1 transporter substrate-binding domain-containing protein [Ancylobacter mangrovi]
MRGLLKSAGLALAVLTVGFTGAHAEGTLDKIKERGKVIFGVRYDFPPVGSVDESGNPVGFGVDLGKMIAKKLGVPVEFVQTTSSSRIPLLQNGSIDAEIGVTTPTVKREEVVDFTIPYIWDSVALIIKKGASKKLEDYAPPKTIAATQGSANIDVVKGLMPNAQFIYMQEYPDAVVSLLNGKSDAVATNRMNAAEILKKYDQLDISDDFYRDPLAIMVRQNDSLWRNYLNKTIQEFWSDGSYQTLYKKWFGTDPNFMMWSQYRLQPGIGQ